MPEQCTVDETPDGQGYKVTLAVDGFTASTFTSSMHLIDDKVAQLRRAIAQQAANAYSENPTPSNQ